jgi:hypothetical protein
MFNWITNHGLKLIFLMCLIFTLVVPSVLAFLGKATGAGIVAVAGILCMVFTQLDKFAEFSGLGFKGKMREMKQAKDKAYASIEAIRELAETLTSLSMEGLIGNSWSGVRSWQFEFELRHKVYEILQDKLGVPKDKADEAVSAFDKHIEIMLAGKIQRAIRDSKKEKLEKYSTERVYGDSIVNHSTREAASTETFWNLARELNVAEQPDVMEGIKDLEYYRQHHKLRRPQKW